MNEFIFTAEEIIYICALNGAKEVAGVEDVFASVPSEKLFSVISGVKDSLTKKSYLTMDFDGNYSPSKDTVNLIDAITNSEKQIAFCITGAGNNKYGMIYIKGGSVYFSERSEEFYHIVPITADKILPYFSVCFNDTIKNGVSDDVSVIDAKALEHAKNLFSDGQAEQSKRILKDADLDDSTAGLLLESYKGKALHLSVLVKSLVPESVYSEGLIYISNGINAIDVSFNDTAEENTLIIKSTSPETEKKKLEKILFGSGNLGKAEL